MTELWFVHDVVEGDYSTFTTETAALLHFDSLCKKYKDEALEDGEFLYDVDIQFGKVYKLAELVDIGTPIDYNDGYYALVVTDLERVA